MAIVSCFAGQVFAHCQVPCGIYDDQMRFERMLEDQKTIGKGIAQIREMASKKDAQSVNQTVRWINTKEEHASNTQKIISEYFMTQRLKSDGENYTKKLTAAHAVMVAAMKCKQSTDPTTAEALEKAIFDFYQAYTGKKPHFHDHDHD
ncbi:MAG: superoxide dismutase, Ni [Planctomycetales bacterium]